MSSFTDLGVPTALSDVLAAAGITNPTHVQRLTIPDALAGRDVLGRSATGSGKTLAFGLPLVTRLAQGRPARPGTPRSVVLAPTRELATQIEEALRPLAAASGLTTQTVFGGVNQNPQARAIARGVDIVVACPGRLADLISQGLCALTRVEITVLDEADHMADLGFLPTVRRLLAMTPRDGQRLLFSATLDRAIDTLARQFLTDPVTHEAQAPAKTGTMEHHVLTVPAAERMAVLQRLTGSAQRTVVFTRTKHGARSLARKLNAAGGAAVDLHGNLSQNARTRNLDAFHGGEATTLVATDIAARGIHVDEVALVIHADPPADHKAYVHRSGRTARAGNDGIVVTLSTPDQAREVAGLMRAAKIRPTASAVRSAEDPLLSTFVDDSVAPPRPMPVPVQATGGGSGHGSGRGSGQGAGRGASAGRGRRSRGRGGSGGQGQRPAGVTRSEGGTHGQRSAGPRESGRRQGSGAGSSTGRGAGRGATGRSGNRGTGRGSGRSTGHSPASFSAGRS